MFINHSSAQNNVSFMRAEMFVLIMAEYQASGAMTGIY